jgi:hypothetical protein
MTIAIITLIGASIGGILTFLGVFITIKFTEKQGREERRQAIIPYIKINNLTELNDKNSIKRNKINAVYDCFSFDFSPEDDNSEDLFIDFEFENIGFGTAFNFEIAEAKICGTKSKSGSICICPETVVIKPDEKITKKVLLKYSFEVPELKRIKEDLEGENKLEREKKEGLGIIIEYEDLYGNKYNQIVKANIQIEIEHKDGEVKYSDSFSADEYRISEPILCNKRKSS